MKAQYLLRESTVPLLFIGLLMLLTRTTIAQSDESSPIVRTAISGKSVTMECSLPKSQPPQIRWMDLVYNSNPSPQVIFDSANNPEFSIDPSHPNRENYQIDNDFTLTISNSRLDDDPGQYMCYSIVDGKEQVQAYQLTVADMLHCSGESSLKVHEETELDCKASFSGENHPQLHWSATDSNGESKFVSSQDKFDIRLSWHMARVSTTAEDDGRKYTCHMKFGDLSDECSIVLNVTYPVQMVAFETPGRSRYSIGEELKCSANGNPKPSVTLSLSGKDGGLQDLTQGVGWSSFTIPSSWLNEAVTVICTASNVVDGKRNEKKTEVNFLVGKKVVPVTTTAAPLVAPVQQSDSSMTIIIGLIIAGAVILLVIIIVMCMRKHKQKKKRNSQNAESGATLVPPNNNPNYRETSQHTPT